MNNAMIFPGQGSQYIGMGKDLYENFLEAREVFQEVDDSLKQKLSELMFNGSADDLTLTTNTQPALMAVSIAIIRILQKQGNFELNKYCKFVAGHSLGEYSALCAAGVFSLKDTAKLLRIRGDAMQNAVPKGLGGMVALIGTDIEVARNIATEISKMAEICDAANDNGGGQVVMSGSVKAMDMVIQKAEELKIKRAIKLPVSAPFHSKMMESAAIKMKHALDEVIMHKPSVDVVANITANAVNDPKQIKDLLVKQVTGSVRWRESVEYMIQNSVDSIIEVGAGKVLSGLVKRINRDMNVLNIETARDIEEFLKNK